MTQFTRLDYGENKPSYEPLGPMFQIEALEATSPTPCRVGSLVYGRSGL